MVFLKNLILMAWSIKDQFTKYFIIGASGVFLDIATLFLLKEYFYLRPVWAVMINQLIMLNYVFFLNKFWAFKSNGMTYRQMVRFYSLALFNYVFSVVWMFVLNETFGVNYLLARILNIALAVSWNFAIYKFWVFVNVNNIELVKINSSE